MLVGFGPLPKHPQLAGVATAGERHVELAVGEHAVLQVHAGPSERQSLRLVDGDGEGDPDRQLRPPDLEGAHLLCIFFLFCVASTPPMGISPPLMGPCSTLTLIECFSILVTTILVPLGAPLGDVRH